MTDKSPFVDLDELASQAESLYKNNSKANDPALQVAALKDAVEQLFKINRRLLAVLDARHKASKE